MNDPEKKLKRRKVDENFRRRVLFPTFLYDIKIENHEVLNSELLNKIYDEKKADEKGLQRSNLKGLGGWHSKNSLHQKAEFRSLADKILNAGNRISTDLGYNPEFRLAIGQMWSIINPPGGANRAHIHPNCVWSGVYYVQTPDKSGDIEFIDPRTQNLAHQPFYSLGRKRLPPTSPVTNVRPYAGQMLIFPNWLYHSVEPNLSSRSGEEADRIVIAFNLVQIRRPRQKRDQSNTTVE